MAGTPTKGGTGAGAVLSINTTGTTFVPIQQMKNHTLPDQKWTYDEVTNTNSPEVGPGVIKESLPTVIDCGEFSSSGPYLPSDAGLLALSTSFATGVAVPFEIQLKPIGGQVTTGNLYAFSAYVQAMPVPSLDGDKVATIKISLKLTTLVTVTLGS